MPTILSTQIIENAKAAVDTYENTASGLLSDINEALNKLAPADFEGDASTGYMEFFNKTATPALETNLESLTQGIRDILDSIGEQLMATVDVQLGEFNKDPSTGGDATTA